MGRILGTYPSASQIVLGSGARRIWHFRNSLFDETSVRRRRWPLSLGHYHRRKRQHYQQSNDCFGDRISHFNSLFLT